MTLKLKICGMRDPENIKDVVSLKPDYLGFIFYPGSKRFVADLDVPSIDAIPENIRKTGVFVDASFESIAAVVSSYRLSAVQLHGSEDAAFASAFKQAFPQVELIKAFGIDERFDFETLTDFAPVVDYFLFDTQSLAHGGSGKQFDWNLLKGYTLNLPFFLSGGIGIESIQAIKEINDGRLYAIDINSKFETAPAVKDVVKLTEFNNQLFSGAQAKGI
ncbi:phosphoribosylanthranilate isomerase [Pedobacter sp.]|uniref:phosphoribosylanthranilate isomerase n=1 Tax=Pedobacter sp. TaxID=1411316 RepID=UPI003D7FD856